jgi:hypothetical protein
MTTVQLCRLFEYTRQPIFVSASVHNLTFPLKLAYWYVYVIMQLLKYKKILYPYCMWEL